MDAHQKLDQLAVPSGKIASGFEREYLEICWSIDKAPWFSAAITPQTKATRSKNRYFDVLPFEQTRVTLPNPRNEPAGDYINANFIEQDYIACCAPIPSAICDFWRMVWHANVHVILMLTNFVERERLKADRYWDHRGRAIDFEGVFVQLDDERQDAGGHGFIVRSFKVWTLADGGEAHTRSIQHVQLTTWPDHGVLRDFRVIAPMLETVNAYKARAGAGARMVVHCSAGIGRSGTFIAIDMILKQVITALATNDVQEEEEEASDAAELQKALDVQRTVHRIRSQRPGMVQTPVRSTNRSWYLMAGLKCAFCGALQEQYEMVYQYIAAVLTNRQPW